MKEEFLTDDMFNPLTRRSLDYQKIVSLSDEDFTKLYRELMSEYRDKDGWWSDGKVPKCFECHTEILGPEQLRRYKGISMHGPCFGQFYAREGDDTGIMQQYWTRVAKLEL